MDREPQGRRAAPDAVWAAVREDYLAGRSAPACARRHGVSVGALRARAARDGWRRSDQPWIPADRLDPWDEGVDLEERVHGDLDKVELCELAYVAHRRMLRAVMRGDAVEALRWRRVGRTLAEVEAEEARDQERYEAILWRRGDDAEHDPDAMDAVDAMDAMDGVFASGERSPPHLDGEVDASPSRADGGGDRVSTSEHPEALAQTTASPPPSRREAASRHLPTTWGGDVKPDLT